MPRTCPPLAGKNSHSKNAPTGVQVRKHLLRIAGVDLLEIPGISASLAQIIISEVGTTLSQFETPKHFCSWLGLAPHNEITGGKVIRSSRLENHNRAGQALYAQFGFETVGRRPRYYLDNHEDALLMTLPGLDGLPAEEEMA